MASVQRKAPAQGQGLKSLNAVITVRHLLREEKQGTTALQLSFRNYFSRCRANCYTALRAEVPTSAPFWRESAHGSAYRTPSHVLNPPPFPAQPPAPPAPRRLHPRPGARTPPARQRPDPAGVRARRPGHHAGRRVDARRAARHASTGCCRSPKTACALRHPGDGAVPGDRAVAQDRRRARGAEPGGPGADGRARTEEALPRTRRDDRRGARPVHHRTARTACSTRPATSSTTRPSRC